MENSELPDEIKLWADFERELIYTNRFFPNVEILSKIEGIARMFADTITEGCVLFRAREYEEVDYILFSDEFDDQEEASEESDKRKRDLYYSVLIKAARGKDSDYLSGRVFSEIVNEKKNSSIWGYSEKESGKPNREKAGLNRASPKYIAYLYLAGDVDTALAEARAQVNQPFSIAEYKIAKSLKIVNLSFSHVDCENNGATMEEVMLYAFIHRAFSSPSNSSDRDYLVSQYIAEYIKKLGYDGIVFDSSRNLGGINYTLFDDSAFEFLGSAIHEVASIKVASRRLLPPE